MQDGESQTKQALRLFGYYSPLRIRLPCISHKAPPHVNGDLWNSSGALIGGPRQLGALGEMWLFPYPLLSGLAAAASAAGCHRPLISQKKGGNARRNNGEPEMFFLGMEGRLTECSAGSITRLLLFGRPAAQRRSTPPDH